MLLARHAQHARSLHTADQNNAFFFVDVSQKFRVESVSNPSISTVGYVPANELRPHREEFNENPRELVGFLSVFLACALGTVTMNF